MVFLFYIGTGPAVGQLFTDINAGLPGLYYSYADWGDFDNDKDLDIMIAGSSSSGASLTKIYLNDNGIFTASEISLENVQKGVVTWGDFDNDGDLDILLSGESDAQRTIVYRNTGADFEELELDIPYFGPFSCACWVDYDSDGDLDFFASGNWESEIYRNDGEGIFTDTESGIAGLNSPRADWGDYDGDGDQDLFVSGDTGGGMAAWIYRNNKGEFEQIDPGLIGLSAGSVEWGDYDSDNDLDLLIMGFDDILSPLAEIYRNDGDNVFTRIYAGLAPVAMGRVTWGDYENDGDLDVLLTGKIAGCGTFTSAVYENLGGDVFNELSSGGLAAAQNSYAAWGDYDKDGDLDILLCGQGSTSALTKIYRNDAAIPNHVPSVPENLAAQIDGTDVVLTWDKATDMETPQDGLTYNIRISTQSMECDLLSPMAHIDDGYRKISGMGNCGEMNGYAIGNLPFGTYYWSVQTIDNAFSPSPFSTEQIFTVGLTGIELNKESKVVVYPNPADDRILIDLSANNSLQGDVCVKIFGSAANLINEFTGIKSKLEVRTSHYDPGVYHVLIIGETGSSAGSFIISR